MHPQAFLVRLLVAETLNGGPAGGLHVRVDVSANRVREACRRATRDKFEPVVLRLRWPRCNGQASRLLRLNIIHAI
jgi:hypothetical protein